MTVAPAARLRGRLRVPGDKSITHRALLLAGMAAGRSTISGASDGLDPRSTARCLAELGVRVDQAIDDDGFATYRVESPGIDGWQAPVGDARLRQLRDHAPDADRHPGRIDHRRHARRRRLPAQPTGGAHRGPLARHGRGRAGARRTTACHPSSSAGLAHWWASITPRRCPARRSSRPILLAGLAAAGTTIVRESVATRDHTERMLRARGVAIETDRRPRTWLGRRQLAGGQHVAPLDEQVTGDVSSAVFWLVAGACHPDAELTLEGVGVNPTRRRAIDLLLAMGARITERDASPAAPEDPPSPRAPGRRPGPVSPRQT